MNPFVDDSSDSSESGDELWETDLTSTCLLEMSYDERDSTLHLKFTDGSDYVYYNVPNFVYKDLENTISPGRYFNYQIRPSYDYDRL